MKGVEKIQYSHNTITRSRASKALAVGLIAGVVIGLATRGHFAHGWQAAAVGAGSGIGLFLAVWVRYRMITPGTPELPRGDGSARSIEMREWYKRAKKVGMSDALVAGKMKKVPGEDRTPYMQLLATLDFRKKLELVYRLAEAEELPTDELEGLLSRRMQSVCAAHDKGSQRLHEAINATKGAVDALSEEDQESARALFSLDIE